MIDFMTPTALVKKRLVIVFSQDGHYVAGVRCNRMLTLLVLYFIEYAYILALLLLYICFMLIMLFYFFNDVSNQTLTPTYICPVSAFDQTSL